MTRRQYALLFTAMIVVSALSGMAGSRLFGGPVSAAANEMEAREFRLVDASGAVRGRFGIEDDGSVRLSFSDAGGQARLWTGILPDGTAMINLRDKAGQPRLFVQVDEREPLIALRDSAGKGRLYLQISANEPLINLRDAEDRGRFFVKAGNEGATLWYNDEQGRTIFKQP